MEIVITSKNKTHHDFLILYKKHVAEMFLYLQCEYNFQLPDKIIFRPMRTLSKQHAFRKVWANAGWSHDCGYFIGLEMQSNLPEPSHKILDTLAHEVAHIAEELHTNQWSHQDQFHEMYDKAKAFSMQKGVLWGNETLQCYK